MKSKTAVIIPALNEASVLGETITSLRRSLVSSQFDLIVVNDGSRDQTGKIAQNLADYVLTHRRNCGLGAAISTGLEFAKRNGYGIVVTFDADGQHDPSDIKKAIAKLNTGYDVVIGSRFLGTHAGLSLARRFILYLSNLVTFLFFGIITTDSQSGFRVLGPRAIKSLRLLSNRMEVSSEFFGEIKRARLKLGEVGIHIRYTDYSKGKGQRNVNGFKILVKLLYQIIR